MAQQAFFTLRDISTGQVYPVSPGELHIGRMSQNDVVLSDEKVSRRHATLWVQGDQVYIRDEGSTNGTWVNERRINAPTVLQPGDRVRIGDTIFEVVIGSPAAVPPPPAEELGPIPSSLPVVPLAIVGGVILLILLGMLLGRRQGASILPTATPSPMPTVLPEATVTLTPTPTETPFAAVTPSPVPATPTPGVRYAAPTLLNPPDGGQYSGPSPMPYPMLEWASVGSLASDEYYRIVIDYPHDGGTWREIGWTKEVRWRVPDYLYGLLSGSRECRWHVEVVQVTATDADGNPTAGVPVSLPSETWTFVWAEAGGGGPAQPTNTPTPEFKP